MTTSDFWNKQEFSYITTYSFNRGTKLDSLVQAASALFQSKHKELLTAQPADLPSIRAELRLLEHTHDIELLALTTELNAFHITATPVAKIEKASELASRVAALLLTPITKQFHWMCGPVYRDALAFYDENDNLVSVLNICFGCDKMSNHLGEEIQADNTIYLDLKVLLGEIGHDITEK